MLYIYWKINKKLTKQVINLFIDKARILLNQEMAEMVRYHLEKKNMFSWWSDGGDSGNGASVIFEVDLGLRTLMDFKYQKKIRSRTW